MKNFILLALLMSTVFSASAQWVTIPDDNFANFLNEEYPDCMDGNQMDTDCAGILNANILDVANFSSNPDSVKIADLSGLQYFVNLESLDCSYNILSDLPELPNSLSELYCDHNNLDELPQLPETLTILKCHFNNLTSLPSFPNSLIELRCNHNEINELPNLPNSLLELFCDWNNLSELPQLPQSLLILNCQNNEITQLTELPESLEGLIVQSNNITELPTLPSSLVMLDCQQNTLLTLPELPDGLETLTCGFNNLSQLPELPSTLQSFTCNSNQLYCLPTLPASLTGAGGAIFFISDNPFTCLPNYVQAMEDEWLAYPLCEMSDLEDNPYDCSSLNGIAGTIFKDNNTNCAQDENENGLVNVPVHLLDAEQNIIATTYSFTNEKYNFVADTGEFTVQIEVENQPFLPSCGDPGNEQEVELSEADPSALGVDFGVDCLTGFDIGTQSITNSGWVFPGEEHILNISAGDLSNWFGLQCAEGIGGSVTVNINGPVSYVGTTNNAIVPNVSGDIQLTYIIDDFGSIDFEDAFGSILETDTTAQADDLICVEVIVQPLEDDTNPGNNIYTQCYSVINSYDPNIKQVWPQDVEPGYDGYFNYTIYFQNTGNAPAFNIEVLDTLDSNLDLNTFELTAYSHDCFTTRTNDAVRFYFNNIMLPDSTSDFEGSIGYVQYRIKAVEDLPVGTIIENTAHIFFDFNDAIVTNTTQNEFVIDTGVDQPQQQLATVFPNPGTGQFNVLFSGAKTDITHLEVYNLSGQRLVQRQVNENRVVLDLMDYPSGMYLLHIRNEHGSEAMKLIKH